MRLDPSVLDRAFLRRQCSGDRALEEELLLLYAATTGRLLAAMPAMPTPALLDAAHRLRGSSQGIGAWAMASAAQGVENAAEDGRGTALDGLAAAFAEAERAIRTHLAAD